MSTSGPLLERLRAHLRDLETDPSTEIDDRLFESCSLALSQTISKEDSISVISQLSTILPTLQSDPTQVIQFLILLVQPFSFSDILSLNGGTDFVAGLDVRAVPYNRLMLALLNKATTSASDAEAVAARPEVVAALVQLWLCTHDTGIAQEAGNTILSLLKADQEAPPGSGEDPLPAHSQGLMWKRMFGDQDVYALLFSVCSLQASGELPKGQRTLAQARLLEWLPAIGSLNWNAITKNHHPEIESQYVDSKGEGLLYFAATSMVDVKDDVLMHRCLIDFFGTLIKTVQQTGSSTHSSISLDFLITHGLHAKSLSYYLDPTNPGHDPLDLQFVYAPSAHYLAAYASNYPEHFVNSPAKERTLLRLKQSLDMSPSRWAHTDSPKHDLHILASLPRRSLLPSRGVGQSAWNTSPVSLLPSRSTNPDVLDTLALIFHGLEQQEISFPSRAPSSTATIGSEANSEAQSAQALYYLYLNYNPKLFEDLVKHAETVALEPHALAAINVIASIITANWAPLSQQSGDASTGLAESDLLSWLPNPPTATPASGAEAILTPPSLEHTVPYLLRPPQTFSSIVGGLGDTENSAYKIAVAKFDALKLLHARLESKVIEQPGQGYEEIVETLRKRIAEGHWGRQGQVGTSIATMEL